MLDGHIARTHNLVTNFGKFIDPIADKLLVMSALVVLTSQGRMPAWVCIVMLGREFAISRSAGSSPWTNGPGDRRRACWARSRPSRRWPR